MGTDGFGFFGFIIVGCAIAAAIGFLVNLYEARRERKRIRQGWMEQLWRMEVSIAPKASF